LLLKEKYEKLLGRMISHDEILKLLSNDKLLKLDERTYTICMLCGLPREFKLRAFFQKLSKKKLEELTGKKREKYKKLLNKIVLHDKILKMLAEDGLLREDIYVHVFKPWKIKCRLIREAEVEPQRVAEGLFLKIRGFLAHKDMLIYFARGKTILKKNEKKIRVARIKLINLFKSSPGREIPFGHQRFYVVKVSEKEREELDNVKYKKREKIDLVWYNGRALNHTIIPLRTKYYVKNFG